ncbi:uncharacterized protein CANTADRAFT_91909 [Suhomyces tanzawaensis NRRL Y-17324]|uniref:Uncharacterized protein n=1 Tax=Suhomyces tanzawaensis NRRL Y-17324 TaxID=984487 RepID=A0A1E4SD69_9ASCO|nr:uncharacterized protein CANTADRAFT_91909 [Suhomyces tanzawaensis NRRL Y-17324]ODV77461.1 hypothetical protein CANTADRAFT_91909 [Suhomyces tanzawaensis NRRL Y-17324]
MWMLRTLASTTNYYYWSHPRPEARYSHDDYRFVAANMVEDAEYHHKLEIHLLTPSPYYSYDVIMTKSTVES